MNIPWDRLFDFLFKLIEKWECGQEASPESKAAVLQTRRGRFLLWMGTRKFLRDEGLVRDEFRSAFQEAYSYVTFELSESNNEELTAFCKGGWDEVEALQAAQPVEQPTEEAAE